MIKSLWYLLAKKSDSPMKGMKMAWEWNWPSMVTNDWTFHWFDPPTLLDLLILMMIDVPCMGGIKIQKR